MNDFFKNLVESRRSVRIFDGTPVPAALINEAIDLAMLSPSSSNLQPWEFHWVRSLELKNKLVTYCFSQPAAKTAAELVIIVARTQTWRRNREEMLREIFKNPSPPQSLVKYYQKLIPLALMQGYLGVFGLLKKICITVIGFFKPIPREPTSISDLKIWAVKSTALASQTFMLAIKAGGFDSCPMEGFDSARVKALFSLPPDSQIVMIVGIGKATPQGIYGKRLRFQREWFVREW